ncbi:hypothetical protein [Streptomyces sp. NPDC046942]|uniref:hypothetical protein n=1 Tax=Streptomyces sp. NPDC046942 TaxID=3155137 RepID=UPI0033FB78EB
MAVEQQVLPREPVAVEQQVPPREPVAVEPQVPPREEGPLGPDSGLHTGVGRLVPDRDSLARYTASLLHAAHAAAEYGFGCPAASPEAGRASTGTAEVRPGVTRRNDVGEARP